MVEMDAQITLEEIPEEEDLLFSVDMDDKAKEMLDVAEKLDHCMDVFLQELDAFFISGECSKHFSTYFCRRTRHLQVAHSSF